MSGVVWCMVMFHGSLISKCKRPKCVGMHFGLVISNLAIQSLVYKGQSKYLVKSTDRAGFTTREDDAGPIQGCGALSCASLPLGGGGRLGRDVEGDARDARHLGEDARLDLGERLERQRGGAGQRGGARHEVAREEGADTDGACALDAEADREEHDGHLR